MMLTAPTSCAAALILFVLNSAISLSALPPRDDEHEHYHENEGRFCRHKPENAGSLDQSPAVANTAVSMSRT